MMNNIRKIARKELLNEVAGISFIVRKWAKILEDEVDEQLALHKEEELKKIKDNPKPTKKETPKQSSFDFPEDEYFGLFDDKDDKGVDKNDPFYWEDETGSSNKKKYDDEDWFSSYKKSDWKNREGGYYKKGGYGEHDDNPTPKKPKPEGYSSSVGGRYGSYGGYGGYGTYTPAPYIPPLEEITVYGDEFPEEYKEFSVDMWVLKNSSRIEYDHWNSGYAESGEYIVYLNVPLASMSTSAFIHEIKHAYDDWNRMRHGGKPIRDTWEIKNIYTKDFEKLVLGGSGTYPQLGSLIRYFYLGSTLETPAYLENEYDGAGVGYDEIGRKLKNFKIDSFFNKQGEPANGLEKEFQSMKKLDIPLLKKFDSVVDFLTWTKKYFNKRGEDIFRRIAKMKYVHGKPISPFEPKPVTYGTYQKPQNKPKEVKKEVPKEDKKSWEKDEDDFEEGEMMGDWKFSKQRGWYYAGEDKYDDYYNY